MIRKQRTAKQSRAAMTSMIVRTSHPAMVSSCNVVAATPVVTRASTSIVSSSKSESGL